MVQHVNNLCRSATLLWARLENCGNTLIRSPPRSSLRHLLSAGLTIVTLFFTVFQRKTFVKFKGFKTWPLAWVLSRKKRDHITSYVISFIGFRLIKEFNSKSSSSHTRLSTVLPHPIWKISSPCMFLPVACGQVMCVLRATSSRLAPVLKPTVSGPLLSLPQRCGMLFPYISAIHPLLLNARLSWKHTCLILLSSVIDLEYSLYIFPCQAHWDILHVIMRS